MDFGSGKNEKVAATKLFEEGSGYRSKNSALRHSSSRHSGTLKLLLDKKRNAENVALKNFAALEKDSKESETFGNNVKLLEEKSSELAKNLIPRPREGYQPNEDIVGFLQELEKQTWHAPLPKCSRFTSYQACRFQIPIDITELEQLTPLQYLQNHCIVTPLKAQSYKKIFQKHCNINIEDFLRPKHLPAALGEIFGRMLQESTLQYLQELVDWEENVEFDELSFIVSTALLERIFSKENKDKINSGVDRKDSIEIADFDGLPERIEGLDISPAVKTLLLFIAES